MMCASGASAAKRYVPAGQTPEYYRGLATGIHLAIGVVGEGSGDTELLSVILGRAAKAALG